MTNCFLYTYNVLEKEGISMPVSFNGYSMNNVKKIIAEYKDILAKEIHYRFFEGFCSYVNEAKKNDVVIHKDGVGVAINRFSYVTIAFSPIRREICTINKYCRILRPMEAI